jgi:hypothetical protein
MTDKAAGRRIAEAFYKRFCPQSIGELAYIDFNYPVRDVAIQKGARLWGFKDPRVSPLRTTFFCVPGIPNQALGVHVAGNLKTNPKVMAKVLNEYEVLVAIPNVLESVCADGVDTWSERGAHHQVFGGGWQYKVPHPERYVRYITAFPQR